MAIPGGDFLTTGLNLISQSLLIPVVIILLIFVVVVVVCQLLGFEVWVGFGTVYFPFFTVLSVELTV